jgi:hypothetical protein
MHCAADSLIYYYCTQKVGATEPEIGTKKAASSQKEFLKALAKEWK